MNKYIPGDDGERVPSYGGSDPGTDRPEKDPDSIQAPPAVPDPIPPRGPVPGGPRLIPDLQFGNPFSGSSNAGSANSGPRSRYSLFGDDRLDLGAGASGGGEQLEANITYQLEVGPLSLQIELNASGQNQGVAVRGSMGTVARVGSIGGGGVKVGLSQSLRIGVDSSTPDIGFRASVDRSQENVTTIEASFTGPAFNEDGIPYNNPASW